MGWVKFWANFSQTHLVTLTPVSKANKRKSNYTQYAVSKNATVILNSSSLMQGCQMV
jgi:hypothetical protein